MTPGAILRAGLAKGVVIAPGAYDALSARIAAKSGAKAVYMSGFGVAGSLLGGEGYHVHRFWGASLIQ